MKRRSKILTGLVAATMAFSTVCFGFSQWSSDITVNGSVSANGKWAVEITELSYDLSSGAAVHSNIAAPLRKAKANRAECHRCSNQSRQDF